MSTPHEADPTATVFRLSSDHAKSAGRRSIGFPWDPLRDVLGMKSDHGCLRPTPEDLNPYARIWALPF